ncbi:hypothetical protein BDQ17DRAFT_1436320 [Cyathus striatus]|nr:hypothetical protein BDQ17DRAFT_1436320 [Cyathus striatus]
MPVQGSSRGTTGLPQPTPQQREWATTVTLEVPGPSHLTLAKKRDPSMVLETKYQDDDEEMDDGSYAGQSTEDASWYELNHNGVFSSSSPVYSVTPRGFPMNPLKVDNLHRIIHDPQFSHPTQYKVYELLWVFHSIAAWSTRDNRDRTMQYILDNEHFWEGVTAPSITYMQGIPEIEHPIVSFSRRASNNTGGVGLQMPAPKDQLRVDTQCRYIAHHGHPGSTNPFTGIAVDCAFHICRRSMFGYLLGRALALSHSNTHAPFICEVAFLMAQPNLYHDKVERWNLSHPMTPFEAQTGPQYTFRRYICDPSSGQNLSLHDVIKTFIINGIPIEELGTIETWSGWWTPSHEDFNHIHMLQGIDIRNNGPRERPGQWLLFGDEPTFHYLHNCPPPLLSFNRPLPGPSNYPRMSNTIGLITNPTVGPAPTEDHLASSGSSDPVLSSASVLPGTTGMGDTDDAEMLSRPTTPQPPQASPPLPGPVSC